MSSAEEPFLKAIRTNPDDDVPRLIFSDWLEERGERDRAEFIRVQCEKARLLEGDVRWEQLFEREQQLLEQNEEKWVQPLRKIAKEWETPEFAYTEKWAFHRGFIQDIALFATSFLRESETIRQAAPVLAGAALWEFDGDAQQLAACPLLRRLRELNIYRNFGDAAVRSLLSSPHLGRLRTLMLSSVGLGIDGIQALADSPLLAKLEVLDLWANNLDHKAAQILTATDSIKGLKWLGLGRNSVGIDGLRVLAASPHLTALEGLDLDQGRGRRRAGLVRELLRPRGL